MLEACEPVYETLPGWRQPTVGIRDLRDLPETRGATSSGSPSWSGTEIGIVSTGPDREQTIIRGQSALASWFD